MSVIQGELIEKHSYKKEIHNNPDSYLYNSYPNSFNALYGDNTFQ